MLLLEKVQKWAREMRERIITAALIDRSDKRVLSELREWLEGKKSAAQTLEEMTIHTMQAATLSTTRKDILADKKLLARMIHLHMEHKYGFREAIKTGNYMPLPHELTEVNCGTQMFVNYTVANACGLNPVIKELDGWRTKGSQSMARHSIIEIDVGEPQKWVLCQPWNILGPVTWDEDKKTLTVQDVIENRKVEIEYTWLDTYTEELYLERLEFLRSPRGAQSVLETGQKLGCPSVDGWKAKRKMPATWWIKYDAKDNTVAVKISIQRPLVQNRGLENKMRIETDGKITEEIRGYYFREDGWAQFLGATEMISISAEKAVELAQGLSTDLDYDKQCALEEKVYDLLFKCAEDEANLLLPAARASFAKLKLSPTYNNAWKFILVEALYQADRKAQSKKKFLYTKREHLAQFQRATDDDLFAKAYVSEKSFVDKLRKILDKANKRRGNPALQMRSKSLFVLDAARLEHQEARLFSRLRGKTDLLAYQLESEANFCNEAADRVCYVMDKFRKGIASLADLEKTAKERLGEGFDRAVMAAYSRMFTEFIGMIAYSQDELRLTQYREKLIEKLQEIKAVRQDQ